jgi:RNA polymerase sigma-70 factor (ECF subfamily)
MSECDPPPAPGPAAGSDEAWFDGLYQQSSQRVLGLCLRMLGSREEAEDAAADAFLKAHRARRSYDRERPFAGWILTIASRVCLDRLRRKRLERRLFAAPVEEPAEPPARADRQLKRLLVGERRRRVRRAIAELPERYRQVLVMRYYGELAYDEIAGALDLRRNHVAVLIHRAKQRLRQLLATGAEEASG